MIKESIFVLRSTKPDRLSTTAASSEPDREVQGCVVVPRFRGKEDTDEGQVIIDGFFVKAPMGTDILATDKVRAREVVWEVDGVPGDFGRKGVLFYLRRVGSV